MTEEIVGIFGDHPSMPTGMAVVLHNLARGLSFHGVRVIFFARFGQEKGFSQEATMHDYAMDYELVNCQGGVWKPRIVVEALKHYDITHMFSEDDWFSASGLIKATRHTKIPLHFLTPIDSLPIHELAFSIFKDCKKVYTPNSSYKLIKNGVYLPHGVDFKETFFPEQTERDGKFTLLWIGRDEPRKALGRFILAFEKIYKKADCQAIIHSDWRAKTGRRTAMYLRHKRDLPITLSQMETGPQEMLRPVYNKSDALVCSSKAGGFEMSITESMACGLIPIVTDWTFMNEIFNDKQGFKIPVESKCDDWVTLWNGKRWGVQLGRIWGNIDIDKLAKKLLWCIKNRDRVKEIVEENTIPFVKRNYDWIKISAKLAEEILND